mmetsp:Transcript_52239/g.117925  ORF Transcript_52239/g.117925 Transcript_52239/m.117925 type:complete len:279 (-) Transcript_52239:39-875(-)
MTRARSAPPMNLWRRIASVFALGLQLVLVDGAGVQAYFIPGNHAYCLQGSKDYLWLALARLKSSPLAGQYANTSLVDGACSEHGYVYAPAESACFPQAVVYKDWDKKHAGLWSLGEFEEVHRYAKQQGLKLVDAIAQMDALCDDGTMAEEAPAPLAPFVATLDRTTGLGVSFVPDSKTCCLQGPADAVNFALARLRASPLASLYRKAQISQTSCSILGFHNLRLESACFARVSIHFDSSSSSDENEMEVRSLALGTSANNASGIMEALCDARGSILAR